MRSVGLDLGARHIAFCEVVAGQVKQRGHVRRLSDLEPLIGRETSPARVAFEACREGWHVHDVVSSWEKEPVMLDTTRIQRIGVGHHGRKNDALDAEVLALALDAGRVPVAHVLSPERRGLRAKLSVRAELVEQRARQIVVIRGLARAKGVLLPTCATSNFVEHVEKAKLDDETRALVALLVATIRVADEGLMKIDAELVAIAENDPTIRLCATAPGVGLIVAATFVSVIDDAKRFRNAHAVSAYLGLVPSETTTGGPNKRRLGAITKQGNTYARSMLVQSAWQILRGADPNDPLRRWGEQIAKTRVKKKIAAVALARKLAGVLWAMWRDGTVYDAGFAAQQSAKGLTRDAQKRELVAFAMARAAKKITKRSPTARLAKAGKRAAVRRSKNSKEATV
jgi:transposase